jgi:hypothetical protein
MTGFRRRGVMCPCVWPWRRVGAGVTKCVALRQPRTHPAALPALNCCAGRGHRIALRRRQRQRTSGHCTAGCRRQGSGSRPGALGVVCGGGGGWVFTGTCQRSHPPPRWAPPHLPPNSIFHARELTHTHSRAHAPVERMAVDSEACLQERGGFDMRRVRCEVRVCALCGCARAQVGNTAVHRACTSSAAVVQLLHSRGAWLEAPNAAGVTPLLVASQFGKLDVVKCVPDHCTCSCAVLRGSLRAAHAPPRPGLAAHTCACCSCAVCVCAALCAPRGWAGTSCPLGCTWACARRTRVR